MKQKNLDIYGDKPIPWTRALEQLEAGSAKSFWLATVRPDGRPHVAAVGALWVDGKIYFTSGPRTRKSRNLDHNPACVISASLPNLDLVIEGAAERVTDAATLQRLAQAYAAQGWPARVSDDAVTDTGGAITANGGAITANGGAITANGGAITANGGAITAEFSAPSAGPPPWYLYVVKPVTAFGVATAEPWGAMRWQFES